LNLSTLLLCDGVYSVWVNSMDCEHTAISILLAFKIPELELQSSDLTGT